MRVLVAILFVTAILWGSDGARAELKETYLPRPLPTQVTLNAGNEQVVGSLVKYDAQTIQIKSGRGNREIKWSELTKASRYSLRSELIDRSKAAEWLELAEFGVQCGLPEQTRIAVANAVRIDPSTRLKGEAILRSAKASLVKYQKSTPEEDAKAIETAQKVASYVADKMKLNWVEIQTPHFIIFTDWDAREHNFLRKNCEASYAAVSKQFGIPVAENVFVGKLPVFMFDKQADFMRYAKEFDGFPVGKTVAGYFTQHDDGSGHMVMWKPDTRAYPSLKEAEDRWAYTLTHEFTHAFISRYRTNRQIPRWLNEGLAEVIASGRYPRPGAHAFAKEMAGRQFNFAALFDDEKMPGGAMYPVMQTMVEALIQENRRAFLAMFDDIKDGMEPEAALKKHYKAGYRDWEKAWRRYAKGL